MQSCVSSYSCPTDCQPAPGGPDPSVYSLPDAAGVQQAAAEGDDADATGQGQNTALAPRGRRHTNQEKTPAGSP